MKKLILCALLGVFGLAPTMFADVVDYLLNVNGNYYCYSTTGVSAPCTSGPSTGSGLAAAGATGTLDTSFGGTGLGTVNLTYNPGAGTYNVGLWLFEELIPASGYDEFGATNGAPASGESWQIDTPDYAIAGDPNTSATGTIIANTEASTLSNTNDVPGGVDSAYGTCGAPNFTPSPNCNDYTSMALSENFTLGAGEEEVLSFNVSTTAPTSGFYLEQIDPQAVTGGPPVTYYYSATATTESICTSNCSAVPEPSSSIPLLGLVGVLALVLRRRFAAA